jgi:hypothetical protein
MPARRRLAVAVLLASAFCLALTFATAARATSTVHLVRVYSTDTAGTVYEVCRGRFDPPATDHENPAFCEGKPERWSQHRWQEYNAGAGAVSGAGVKEPKAKPEASKEERQPVATGTPAAAAKAFGGSVDPNAVLGVENPLCGESGELSTIQQRNCASSGSPESPHSLINYGWDIHIGAGGFFTAVFTPAVSFFLLVVSILWLGALFILKLCLIVLGFAFSLSPFTDNHILAGINRGLHGLYAGLTEPWLETLFVILGGWGLYNGLIRRRAAESIGGAAAAMVMMLGALWVIQAPGQSVGRVAEVINETALEAVSAPASGSVSAPVRNYGDATGRLWNEMTAVPFCAFDFSDINWCLHAKPSKGALEAVKGAVPPDPLEEGVIDAVHQGAPLNPLAVPKAVGHFLGGGESEAEKGIKERAAALAAPANSIADLYLRFSSGSPERDALWDYYNGKEDEHVGLPLDVGPQLDIGGGSKGAAPDKVAIQGRSGVLTRLLMLIIFTLGLLGGVLLLLWIAIRVVLATAASFILILAAPLAMFFPVFGEAGRRAFIRWATSLLGAIVSKLTFAALLGIVLLGSSILGAGIGRGSPTLGLIATMAFWWAAFLGRDQYLSIFQVGPVGQQQSHGFERALAGGYLGYRVASSAHRAFKGHRAGVEAKRRRRSAEVERGRVDSDRAQRVDDDRELDGLAEQRLDSKMGLARERVTGRERMAQEVTALRRDPETRRPTFDQGSHADRQSATAKSKRLKALQEVLKDEKPQAQIDAQLLRRAERNSAAGLPRYSAAELEGAKREIRREAELPADHRAHSWRASAQGLDPNSEQGRQVIEQGVERTKAAEARAAAAVGVKLHRAGASGTESAPIRLDRRPPRPERERPTETEKGPRAERRFSFRDKLSR